MPDADEGKKAGWGVIVMLSAAQFVMVLDTTVMNVSISQIVADLNTTALGLQTAITIYTLVMAAFMLDWRQAWRSVGREAGICYRSACLRHWFVDNGSRP